MPQTVDIDFGLIEVGDEVTAWFKPDGNSGQGGKVHLKALAGLILKAGTAGVEIYVDASQIHHWTTEVPFPAEECLNYGPDCSGPVDWWHSGGLSGRSWPRCTFHGEKRLRDREHSMERYADSDVAPSWFDEGAIGERWDDDY